MGAMATRQRYPVDARRRSGRISDPFDEHFAVSIGVVDPLAMRRILLVMLCAMLVVPATAHAITFTATDHQLGRSHLDPANVSGAYTLALPAGTTDGAEIKSVTQFASGTVSTRLKVADAPSSITGFFLYAPPDLASEIDIEIYNDPSGTVMYSTYAG